MMKSGRGLHFSVLFSVLFVAVTVVFFRLPGTFRITANKATVFHNIQETLRNAANKTTVFHNFQETLRNAANKMINSATLTVADKVVKLNPGCKNRTIMSYDAHDVGKVYDHPPIVHYAMVSRPVGQLSFRDYTSVLSVYKFVKPQKIIFHINFGKFSGKYWEKINAFEGVTIEVNKIPKVEKIGSKRVIYGAHAADFVKLNMVHKYGGIALDFDVIMINGSKLKNEQRISECFLSVESWLGRGGQVNIGFFSCIKNSSFIAKWLEGYHKNYNPRLWLYNSGEKPTSILTDKKNDTCYNVQVDNSICVLPKVWLMEGAVKWRNKIAGHYFLKKVPHDGEGLLLENFPLAKLVQYVHNA